MAGATRHTSHATRHTRLAPHTTPRSTNLWEVDSVEMACATRHAAIDQRLGQLRRREAVHRQRERWSPAETHMDGADVVVVVVIIVIVVVVIFPSFCRRLNDVFNNAVNL